VLNASQKGLLEWMVACNNIVLFTEASHSEDHDRLVCGSDNRSASRRDLEVLVRQGLAREVAPDSFRPTAHGRDLGGHWRE
jgi:hypothetical protein